MITQSKLGTFFFFFTTTSVKFPTLYFNYATLVFDKQMDHLFCLRNCTSPRRREKKKAVTMSTLIPIAQSRESCFGSRKKKGTFLFRIRV